MEASVANIYAAMFSGDQPSQYLVKKQRGH
jgi:hypothetical protein